MGPDQTWDSQRFSTPSTEAKTASADENHPKPNSTIQTGRSVPGEGPGQGGFSYKDSDSEKVYISFIVDISFIMFVLALTNRLQTFVLVMRSAHYLP